MKIIAFCGPKTSGKDTAANYLRARNTLLTKADKPDPFIRINFADTVKQVCQATFGLSQQQMWEMPFKEQSLERWPYKSPRILMQTVANVFRTHFGGSVWAIRWAERIKGVNNPVILVTDLRHVEELDVMDPLGAIYIYVENDKVEAERARGISQGDPAWSDSSEAFADLMKQRAHYILPNNGTIPELHSGLEKIMQQIVDHPDWLTHLVDEAQMKDTLTHV